MSGNKDADIFVQNTNTEEHVKFYNIFDPAISANQILHSCNLWKFCYPQLISGEQSARMWKSSVPCYHPAGLADSPELGSSRIQGRKALCIYVWIWKMSGWNQTNSCLYDVLSHLYDYWMCGERQVKQFYYQYVLAVQTETKADGKSKTM